MSTSRPSEAARDIGGKALIAVGIVGGVALRATVPKRLQHRR